MSLFATVVIPTFNERESLPLVVEAVRRAMTEHGAFEIVVVDDDSPDKTWEVAEEIGRSDPRVRLLRRRDKKGLSSAIVDGLRAGQGERLCVIDADLQHDASKVPLLLAALDGSDLAVGTRYAEGGGTGDWAARRRWLSRMATWATRTLLRVRVSDPMSGFFAIRRDAFAALADRLDPRGYKILMELLYHHGPGRVAEVPYVFTSRRHGESKLGGGVAVEGLRSLLALAAHRILSARWSRHVLLGLVGVAAQLGLLWLLRKVVSPAGAQACAVVAAGCFSVVVVRAWTRGANAYSSGPAPGLGRLALAAGAWSGIGYVVAEGLQGRAGFGLVPANLAAVAAATLGVYLLDLLLTRR